MGTSASSRGPGGNVPLIPPWVPQVTPLPAAPVPTPAAPREGAPSEIPSTPASPSPGTTPASDEYPPTGQSVAPTPPPVLAPPRRFKAARTSLGRFARSGDQRQLASGLRHYSRTGLGGARRAAQRMGGTSKTAGVLYVALHALGMQAVDGDTGLDPASLRGLPPGQIRDRIIDAVRPLDGTQDAEASRCSINDAIKDVLNQHADADLLTLSPEQIELIMERYIAYDLCRRVELDIGNAVSKAAASVAEGVRRMQEVKSYIQEKVSACFRAMRARRQRLTRVVAASFAARVIEDTFVVFEEFVG